MVFPLDEQDLCIDLYTSRFFMLQNYKICSVCTNLLYEYGTNASVYGMKCMWV